MTVKFPGPGPRVDEDGSSFFLLVTFFVFLSLNADQETRARSRRQITDTEGCAMQAETREEKRRVTRVSGAFFVDASAAHDSHTRSVCTY